MEHALASQGIELMSLELQPGATYLAMYKRTDSGDERTYSVKIPKASPTATVNAISDDARRR